MPNWLARQATLSPGKLALIAGEVRWTFAELESRARKLAQELARLGVGTGDRVAVLCQNGAHLVTLIHALMKRGAVLVPFNLRLSVSELAWQVQDVKPHLFFYDAAHERKAAGLLERFPDLKAVQLEQVLEGRPLLRQTGHRDHSGARHSECESHILEYLDRNQVHCIIYTSGTTGKPKGAMLTYGNHWWSATGSALNLGNLPDDRWLACVPLFHVSGLSILMRSVILGIPMVLLPGFDPDEVNRVIEEEKVTIISVVSNMLRRMLEAQGNRPYPSHLRCVLLGGGPAPRTLLEACAERGIPVVQTYGMTETASQVVTLPPHEALRKLGSAGKPLFSVELRIASDGEETAPGEVGEILIRGPNVTAGYFGRPEETAKAIRDGWLHTGDLGYLDDEGFLYVLDRRHDLIISGGENVYPAEVEAVLSAHPHIVEAGVVGVPDEQWGQVPVAVVRVRDGVELDEQAVIAFCRERLASYKVPRKICRTEQLPYNASGKLVRHQLRQWLLEGGL
ncbi:MAG: O-succinylbenzoate-CoA ligase [Bacillus thermozeamaize]|uniref:2-succinylbenzoate--CoA ligase n=1 Tax=Bacillus thermozeamaize TaxID=230954 RepID=A0A1Y3PFQ7_9BACI|nr:MAG: O-succinylbenzoate-CoA ligase [Bacillus thermozeamaize]